jgi:hypothetical protein
MHRNPRPTATGAALLLALLPATLAQAGPELILDLATVTPTDAKVRWVYGSTGTGSSGVPVAGGRDLNADGLPDYAVAFMQADPFGRGNAGEIDLVFGDGSVAGFVDTSVTTDPNILRISGAHALETAGSEIWIDDVDGDGLGDLLICRQNHSPAGRNGAGALTLLKGGAELTGFAAGLAFFDLAAPPAGLASTTLIGAAAGDRLCIWTRTGDVTGDGIADIVVAADQADLAGNNSGVAYVLRGGPHLFPGGHTEIDLAGFGTTTLPGHIARFLPPAGSTGFHLGATCQIGDLDGNGRAEVMAAAALNRAGAALQPPGGGAEATGGSPDGSLYIAWDDNFSGNPWPNGLSFDISASPGARTIINGEDANVTFGEEILAGLDYDNDGHADLFVGDLVGDGTGSRPQSGIGYVFYHAADLKGLSFDLQAPPPGLTVSRLFGPSPGAIAADTVAHGDFDNDGIADLAFASPHAAPQGRVNAGMVHVLFGQDGAWPAVIDTAALPEPQILRMAEIQGAHGNSPGNTGDTLSYSAAAGDVDSDGHTDLITNEMVGDGIAPGSIDVGNLILVAGTAVTPPGIALAPAGAGHTVCAEHSVTARVADGADRPLEGIDVLLEVTDGPNAGLTEMHLTDAAGQAILSYASNGSLGSDRIGASFVDAMGITRAADSVVATWTAPDDPNAEPTIAIVDIDDDGAVAATTDGLLAIRYALGARGAALVADPVDTSGGNRASAAQIRDYLARCSLPFDIDADGRVDALTDGLLILRYLLGLRGNDLIAGAIDRNGARTTKADVEAYLHALTGGS